MIYTSITAGLLNQCNVDTLITLTDLPTQDVPFAFFDLPEGFYNITSKLNLYSEMLNVMGDYGNDITIKQFEEALNLHPENVPYSKDAVELLTTFLNDIYTEFSKQCDGKDIDFTWYIDIDKSNENYSWHLDKLCDEPYANDAQIQGCLQNMYFFRVTIPLKYEAAGTAFFVEPFIYNKTATSTTEHLAELDVKILEITDTDIISPNKGQGVIFNQLYAIHSLPIHNYNDRSLLTIDLNCCVSVTDVKGHVN